MLDWFLRLFKKRKKEKTRNVIYFKYYKLKGKVRRHVYKSTIQNESGLVLKSMIREIPIGSVEITKEEYENARIR